MAVALHRVLAVVDIVDLQFLAGIPFHDRLTACGSHHHRNRALGVDNQLNDLQDGKFYSGEVSVERALSATTGVALTASATRQALRDPGYSTTGWRLGLLGWHDLGRMTFTAGAEFGRLHADERLSLFPDKRADSYSRLSVGMTFRRLAFQGFAPVARFVVERNKSSIAFYDYSRRRTELGFIRAF